ncbi:MULTISPECIES: M20 aminoacylase family protein [Roseobacteraceae]|uniref:M20 aminoacylase family protein n=1 Tax=Roseobacteraceae TaxID=2854170 RepID=UPI0013B6BEC5|nr:MULTISPECIES: M20 aminoacylase family protein [unclassified Salipiger]NDV51003.1 amidohydrolase [Salipiger sp. PrR003]NDW33941.1 amidohydrolase [Salipiger sp. PrR007]
MPIVNRIADYADEMRTWRRHLHQNPELSLDCHETAAFVVARLREFGITEIHEGIAQSGVVAIIEGQGEGPVTGLRADMDALPMDEETGAEHASRVPGKMHACGHDGHTTMLLGAAKYLSETRNFAGKVALIFQPAEETIGGGRIMVEEGIMDRFGISEVYAIHTDPSLPLGTMATTRGPIMAAVDDFELVLTGKGGHAAHPDLCIDPVPCALAIGQALLSVPSRNADPLKSLVVSLTTVQGGSATNVIPETMRLAGTIRSFDPGIRAMAERRLREIVEGQAMAYGVSADLDFQPNYPPTVNHAAQTDFAVGVASGVVSEVLDEIAPSMGAEDFSYMLEARPGSFLYLGQGIGPSVHHPKFDFNDEAAPLGASYFVKLIETRQPLRT